MRSIAGTAAMFLVGGGILVHGIPALHHWAEELAHASGLVTSLAPVLLNAATGVVAGGLTLGLVSAAGRLLGGARAAAKVQP